MSLFDKIDKSGKNALSRAKRLFPKTAEAVTGNHDSQHIPLESQHEHGDSTSIDPNDQDAALKRLIQKGVEMDPEFANRMLSTVEQYADMVRQRNIVATGIYAVPASTTSAERNPRAEHDRHWMDLFFDLIYVASAFQLGVLLEQALKHFQEKEYDEGISGIVIFIATFAGIFHTWQQKLDFAARFSSSDLFHRVWDIIEACVIACVAVNIPSSVEEFEDTKTNALWMFAFFKVVHQCISIGRWIEIAILSRTSFTIEHALTTSAGAVITGLAGPIAGTVASMAGTIILSPLNDRSAKAIHRQARSTGYFFAFTQIIGLVFQIVAFALAFSPDVNVKTVCALWIVSSVVENTLMFFRLTIPLSNICCSVTELVPMDVKYAVHRIGEWTMLILGEGVLSMILVNAESFWLHFATFIPGFIVLVMLQVMYYSSQPHHYEAHALYRDKYRGFFWFVSQPFVSGVIIVLDVSIKLVLKYQAKIPSEPKYQIFVWLLCVSLCLLLIMIMTSQILHNGPNEEFYEFSKNSPFAAVVKFGLWGARLIAAFLIVPIPLIPSLPAWAVLIICSILTVAQVVMLVMMTLLNEWFDVAAIKRDLHKKHHGHVDVHQKGGHDVETGHAPGLQRENSDNSARTGKEPIQLQTSMAEINSPGVVIPPQMQRNPSSPKMQKQPSEKQFDLSAFISDPTSLSSADVQRLFNVYGREKLQEILRQQAENVIGQENINTAQNVAKTAQSVANTAQTVATSANRFANMFS